MLSDSDSEDEPTDYEAEGDGYESAYSGDSGKDPEARGASPSADSAVGAARGPEKRQNRCLAWIKGLKRRHTHAESKFRLMGRIMHDSAARTGSDSILITLVKDPAGGTGGHLFVECTPDLNSMCDRLRPQLLRMAVHSVKSARYMAKEARILQEPCSADQLPIPLLAQSVRFGMEVVVYNCHKRYPWTLVSAVAAAAAAGRGSVSAAASADRDEVAAVIGCTQGGFHLGMGDAPADSAELAAPVMDSARPVAGEPAAGRGTLQVSIAAGAEVLAADPRLHSAECVALEIPYLQDVLSHRIWSNPQGTDWSRQELLATFTQLALNMTKPQRDSWLRKVERSGKKEGPDVNRLKISSAINKARDAAKKKAADATQTHIIVPTGANTHHHLSSPWSLPSHVLHINKERVQ